MVRRGLRHRQPEHDRVRSSGPRASGPLMSGPEARGPGETRREALAWFSERRRRVASQLLRNLLDLRCRAFHDHRRTIANIRSRRRAIDRDRADARQPARLPVVRTT